jgi:hypothetical protein
MPADTSASEPIILSGACHCGAIRFAAELPLGLASARRCTCSICRMRGAVVVTGSITGFRLLEGADKLATYQFGTRIAEHHFCSACGIYTHHKRRSNPEQFGINVASLDGLSPFDFERVTVNDGELHPSDNGGRTRVAGELRYRLVEEP